MIGRFRTRICRYNLFFGNSAYRASAGAGTAANAGVGIDFKFAVPFADCAYRTLTCTGTARNTSVTNYKCHNHILLIYTYAIYFNIKV